MKGYAAFGVDHYRPQKRFAELATTYSNLFYCCNQCNSRKREYWPPDNAQGEFIPNPCDHRMYSHLRFDERCEVVARSTAGLKAIEILDFNDDESVDFRNFVKNTLSLQAEKISDIDSSVAQLEALPTSPDVLEAIETLREERSVVHRNMQRLMGSLPIV